MALSRGPAGLSLTAHGGWVLGSERSFQPHPRYSSCGDNQCGLIAEGQWKGFRGV